MVERYLLAAAATDEERRVMVKQMSEFRLTYSLNKNQNKLSALISPTRMNYALG